MKDSDFTIREIDSLLEHLYKRLRGKKEGLSLVEPAAILLSKLKDSDDQTYRLYASRFFPIIVDALIAESFVSFGYDGLTSLLELVIDIPLLSGEYTPESVEKPLKKIQDKINRINSLLKEKVLLGEENEFTEEAADEKPDIFNENKKESAGVPFISVYATGSVPLTTGRVIQLSISLEITGESSLRNRYEPYITFDHISAEPNSSFEKQVFLAINLAEKYVSTAMSLRSLYRIPRRYTISFPEIASLPDPIYGMVTGGSAGFAITAILISLLSQLDLIKISYSIHPGTAFTGKIDGSGQVKAVEEGYISEKMRSVFYSTYDKLVIPKENLQSASKKLDSLLERHPARKLEIIPISSISDLCNEPRVMQKRRSGFWKTFFQHSFHWRKHIITSSAVLAAVLIYFFSLAPYLDRKIATVEFSDSTLVMRNKIGKKVTSFNTGFTQHRNNNSGYQRFFLEDYDNDGKNEAVCFLCESRFGHMTSPAKKNRLHIFIFDEQGRFVQRQLFDDETILGDDQLEGRGSRRGLFMRDIIILNDRTGQAVFFAPISHLSFSPASLLKYSVKTNNLEVFFHRGMLRDMRNGDYDGDGVTDIILSGYNTVLQSAVLVVLDPDHINGSSPYGHAYSAPGYTDDIAKYYIRMPHFYKYLVLRSEVKLDSSFHEDNKGLSLLVKSREEDVRFYFDNEMACFKAIVCDCKPIPRKYECRDSIAGVVKYDGIEEDQAWLAKNVQYWDGEKWVSEPVMNKSYLDLIAKKRSESETVR